MEELEIMRKQLADMKRTLDTQLIINSAILRKLMRRKASWLNRFVSLEIILLPVTYIFFAVISAKSGVSQWYAVIYLILATLDVVFDWRNVRIPTAMISEASLLQLRKFLIRQKKDRALQMSIALPSVIIWVFLFLYALYSTIFIPTTEGRASAAMTGALIGGGIGLLMAIPLTIALFKKMQRTNDSLLSDISELETCA